MSTTNTTKRRPGRPQKADKQLTASLEVNSQLSEAVEQALKIALNGAPKPEAEAPPREIKPSEYKGTIIRVFPRRSGKEGLIVGRRQYTFRKREYDFVDIRNFYFDAEKDQWFPTSKGITVQLTDGVEFIKAVAAALA